MKKLTIEFIRERFEEEDYKLLTTNYKNNKQKLKYICPNNHKRVTTWSDWQQGKRCLMCYRLNCAGKNSPNYGRKFSVEHKIKLSRVRYGKKLSKETKDKISKIHKGRILSKEHKRKIAETQTGKNNSMYGKCGSLSPTWKGGISCEPYCFKWSSKEFKDFIKERDGNKCLNPDCFGNVHKLCVHHIDYNKKHCEPDNLITLCRSCNSRANKDREWHESWYKGLIYRRYLS